MLESEMDVDKDEVPNNSETPPTLATYASELEEEFTCAICFELIVMPTTLNCGHTFCRHCLAHWCDVGKKNECPSCREKFVGLPLENIQIKSSLKKLFSGKYESRRLATLDNPEDVNAMQEFENVIKKQREEEDITAASCGFLIGVAIAVVVISGLYIAYNGTGSAAAWTTTPLQRWTVEDVSYWLEDLDLHSYKVAFTKWNVDGERLANLNITELAPMFYMYNPDHQVVLMEALDNVKSRSLEFSNLWQFKAMNSGYASFLLYAMGRTPRLALLYLSRYDENSYNFYKETVHTCNHRSNRTDDWWFYAGSFVAPHFLHLKFVLCFSDLHYWISRFLIVQCVCKGLLDLISIGRSIRAPQNISYFGLLCQPFLTIIFIYIISYVWQIVPIFITDAIFYAEIYFAPIYYMKQLFSQLFRR